MGISARALAALALVAVLSTPGAVESVMKGMQVGNGP